MCSLHFKEDDFQIESKDKKQRRIVEKDKEQLTRKKLLPDAVPSIFPNLPEHFNKSCYEHISLLWWTNLSDSSYEEKHLPLEKTQVTLAGQGLL